MVKLYPVSFEAISLEHFSATKNSLTLSAPKSRTHHAVFYSFFSDDSKQYAATTATHRKHIAYKATTYYVFSVYFNKGKYI